jgi:Protein of unknown function (DUF3618)
MEGASVTVQRSPDEIQHEIERARTSLAATVDQLAERTNPKRLANLAKSNVIAWTKSPKGAAIVGGTTLLVTTLIVARIRVVRRRT